MNTVYSSIIWCFPRNLSGFDACSSKIRHRGHAVAGLPSAACHRLALASAGLNRSSAGDLAVFGSDWRYQPYYRGLRLRHFDARRGEQSSRCQTKPDTCCTGLTPLLAQATLSKLFRPSSRARLYRLTAQHADNFASVATGAAPVFGCQERLLRPLSRLHLL